MFHFCRKLSSLQIKFVQKRFYTKMESNQTNDEWKNDFAKSLIIPALKLPKQLCNMATKQFHHHLFGTQKSKPIVNSDDDNFKLLLLKEDTPVDSDKLFKEFIESNKIEIVKHKVEVDYSHFSTAEALRKILPSGMDLPTSFETIGHVAHVNLRNEYEPFKYKIAQIILDKNPIIKTVVNKVGNIESEFRTFKMELLAGEYNLQAEVKESNCRFRFNFEEVYWNSRLHKEHERLVDLFTKTDIICDMFAGVGPFAVPAAKNKNSQVYANDLNPKSYHYLVQNANLNKVSQKIFCYNMDARDFVRKLVTPDKIIPFNHVIMNLPASAVEFLDVFVGLYSHLNKDDIVLPTIHCYGFSAEEDPKADIVLQIEKILNSSIQPIRVHEVRDVAPKKLMLCVSFKLPMAVAVKNDGISKRTMDEKSETEPNGKKNKS